MAGHPLSQLVVVIAACAVASTLFGFLKALRGPVGMLAYGGLVLSLYAYYRMGDRYFSQSVWQISVACLVVMWLTLRQVPFLRVVLLVALVEFGSRITRTAYPKPTLLGLGVTAAMLAVATFWTGKTPGVAAPPQSFPPAYGRGPGQFDPYTGKRLRKQRGSRVSPSALWRWARGGTRTSR